MAAPVPKVASSQAALGTIVLQVIVEVLKTGEPQRLSVTDASGATIFITIERPEEKRAQLDSAKDATPFHFAWRTAPTVKETTAGWLPQLEQGHAFRAIRAMYGLTLREVADRWGISHVELGELERGHRHFTAPADMQAALSQLWLWATEKNPEIVR